MRVHVLVVVVVWWWCVCVCVCMFMLACALFLSVFLPEIVLVAALLVYQAAMMEDPGAEI